MINKPDIELCKQMKGFESEWWWVLDDNMDKLIIDKITNPKYYKFENEHYPAPQIEEMLEVLPDSTNIDGEIMVLEMGKEYVRYYSQQLVHSCMHHILFKEYRFKDTHLINASIRMWLWLREEER